MSSDMTTGRTAWRGLVHHRRIYWAVAAGVAAATAVLTGALLVGDSVRGSLRDLTLDRLGRIDHLLVLDRFFSDELAARLEVDGRAIGQYDAAVAAVLLPQGTLEARRDAGVERATGVLVVGGDADFWSFQPSGTPPPRRLPEDGQIVLNEPLAAELGVQVGDTVVLRLPKANQVPADSALGRKTDLVRSLTELEVIEILPARGLGRFSLQPSQHLPRNAYLARRVLQDALNVAGRSNAMLVAQSSASPSAPLDDLLRPTLADYGLKIQKVTRQYQPEGEPERTAFEYFQLTSDRLVIDTPLAAAAQRAWGELSVQPVFTYLANTIQRVDDKSPADQPPGDAPAAGRGRPDGVPYSTVAAIDSIPQLGPLLEPAPDAPGAARPIELEADEIVLNRWTADQLAARPGDTIRLRYFEPETTHGEAIERTAEFRLRAIAPLAEPFEGFRLSQPARYHERPELTNDSDLTPTVEGVTDQESIDDWDPPFPYDSKRVRSEDDDYWAKHRTTPKAFVSLAAGQKLWGSRFGRHTALRVPTTSGVGIESLEAALMQELRRSRVRAGLEFQPIKQRSLAASSGTTPFDALFLSLSFFLIAAGLLLVGLLFRLGIEQRAAEIGVLLATGWTPAHAARLFAAEGSAVAVVGGAAGTAVGVGYAWLLLVGLRTWWLGAVATPFLELHATPRSLAIGFASGVCVTIVIIFFSLRQTRRIPVRRLLAGQFVVERAAGRRAGRDARPVRPWRPFVPSIGWAILAAGLSIGATRLGGEAQAGAFVGAGLAVLTSLLLATRQALLPRGPTAVDSQAAPRLGGLFSLAARNAARNAGRSTATIGLVAVAVFMIVALSAFRLDPHVSGAGGFDLAAESSQPIFADLMNADARNDLLADRAAVLEGSTIQAFRLRPGDDASCTNLYQSRQPRILGVPRGFAERFVDGSTTVPFAWAGTLEPAPTAADPWRRLARSSPNSADPIPVVLDKNTALYGLHLYGGVGQEFSLDYDEAGELRFQVVGLLSNSVLQGALLIDEAEFLARFPEVSGYRYFLVRSGPAGTTETAAALEDRLGDQGFDARSTAELLAGYLAVQNTYLSTFQSLGALGLLLGTFGLATVQVRAVVERRGELALLRAAGFRRRRLAGLVMAEHLLLLGGGMAVGLTAALAAVLPHWWSGGAAVPWRELGPLLAVVLAVGAASGLAAVRTALSAPLIAALRGD